MFNKTLILTALLTSFITFSQSNFRLNETQFFAVSVVVDPSASYKEKGACIGLEIETVRQVYVRASVTNFSALKDGYTDFTGAFGLSFTSGYFERVRYYAGGRLGFISRKAVFPTAGVEAGLDVMLSDTFFVGVRSTYDYRSDFEFYDYPNEMRYSGFIKAGFKF
jgi:hypothetical protein